MIEAKEGEAIVLVKARAPPGFKEIVQDFDAGLVLVWTAPMKVTRVRIGYSFIGDENSIRKVIAFLRVIGKRSRYRPGGFLQSGGYIIVAHRQAERNAEGGQEDRIL